VLSSPLLLAADVVDVVSQAVVLQDVVLQAVVLQHRHPPPVILLQVTCTVPPALTTFSSSYVQRVPRRPTALKLHNAVVVSALTSTTLHVAHHVSKGTPSFLP
jgi:hypothetical protein